MKFLKSIARSGNANAKSQSTKQPTAEVALDATFSTSCSKADGEDAAALELYRGEIEALRKQLRESQEAQRRDSERETEIAELRRQLMEARGGSASGAPVTPPPKSRPTTTTAGPQHSIVEREGAGRQPSVTESPNTSARRLRIQERRVRALRESGREDAARLLEQAAEKMPPPPPNLKAMPPRDDGAAAVNTGKENELKEKDEGDFEAVESAVRYLDSVIQRVSKARTKKLVEKAASPRRRDADGSVQESSPRRSRSSVEIILPSAFHEQRNAAGAKVSSSGNADDAVPQLEPSLPGSNDEEQSRSDGTNTAASSVWQPAGAVKTLIDGAQSVDTSSPSWVGQLSMRSNKSFITSPSADDTCSGSWQPAGATRALIDSNVSVNEASSCLRTAASGLSVDDTASWQPAGATKALIDGNASVNEASSCLQTVDDTASWQPVGAMAALLAASVSGGDDCSSVVSNGTWMTAADDDDLDDDMQTCISALTMHTSLKQGAGGSIAQQSKGGSTLASSVKQPDDSAVIVAELYRIQSLLCSVLEKKKEQNNKGERQQGGTDGDDDESPKLRRISSRAQIISRLWKKHENATTTVAEEIKKQAEAEQLISSLAGFSTNTVNL